MPRCLLPMMPSLLPVSPILLVLGAIVVLRQPPVRAALAGAVLAVALALAGVGRPVTPAGAWVTLVDTLVLFANVVSVVLPGLALVVLLERAEATLALKRWVASLGLHDAHLLAFIVLGMAPLLESMTGFGVSMVAIMPVLMSLFDR